MATLTDTQSPPEQQTSTGTTGPEVHQTQAQPESSKQSPLNVPPQTTPGTGSSMSSGTAGTGSTGAAGGVSSGTSMGASSGTGTSMGTTTGAGGSYASSGTPSRTSGSGMSRRGSLFPPSPFGDPFSMMRSMMDQMDRLFGDFMGPGFNRLTQGMPNLMPSSPRGGGEIAQSPAQQGFWYPQVEVSEREGNLVVCADLPGLRKEDVHLEVHDDYLVLQGERRQESEQNQGGVYRTERSYGRFFRTVPLPEGASTEQARANFKDGVLEVTIPMPKREERPQGRRIEIT
jgi:HSP20 family protein